jgi:cytochrome oxidase assembly protein ShyY1
MVTRFRIEAVASNIEEVQEELAQVASEFMRVALTGPWECTDEVVYREKRAVLGQGFVPTGRFKGRAVFVYRGEEA